MVPTPEQAAFLAALEGEAKFWESIAHNSVGEPAHDLFVVFATQARELYNQVRTVLSSDEPMIP